MNFSLDRSGSEEILTGTQVTLITSIVAIEDSVTDHGQGQTGGVVVAGEEIVIQGTINA